MFNVLGWNQVCNTLFCLRAFTCLLMSMPGSKRHYIFGLLLKSNPSNLVLVHPWSHPRPVQHEMLWPSSESIAVVPLVLHMYSMCTSVSSTGIVFLELYSERLFFTCLTTSWKLAHTKFLKVFVEFLWFFIHDLWIYKLSAFFRLQ